MSQAVLDFQLYAPAYIKTIARYELLVALFALLVWKSRAMASTIELLLLLFSFPTVFSVSFPLTAITEYSSLAQCAQSHVSVELSMWSYAGCSLAPISAYGSCICAERLSSLQREISIAFEFDTECSSTSVQPFVTAFCDYYGVDLAEKEKGAAHATATAGGSQTGPTGLRMRSLISLFL